MKKLLFIAVAVLTLAACGNQGEDSASTSSVVSSAPPVDEQAVRDSVEAAMKDSIAKAEAAKAQEEQLAAAAAKRMHPGYYRVVASAPLYGTPGDNGRVITTLRPGTTVTLQNTNGRWCHVMIGQDGAQGWVDYKALKFSAPFEEYD